MMVGFILTSVLLLVLPSLICGTTTTINVDDSDSESLQLRSFPDELTISGTLNVICTLTGVEKPDEKLSLNIEVADNLLTPLYEDSKDLIYHTETDSYTKSVQVTFSLPSDQMPLQEQPIRVTVSTSFHDISVEVTSNITDNRVGIGFLAESEQIRTCYPKKICDLAVKISHSNDNFDVTINLLNEGKNVSHTTLSVVDGIYHPNVTFPEQGGFTAVLSVADKDIESRVYWSKKTLPIIVVANITELQNSLDTLTKLYRTLWEKYQNLSEEYHKLESQVDSLLTAPAVDIPCQSDPCGTRGTCQVPDDSAGKDYECKCFSDDVIGDSNCTVCRAGYCNEPNGVCSVGEDGQPNCNCNDGYTGDSCEFKECNDSEDCGESMVCNDESHCVCQKGYLGKDCQAICSFNPCGSGGDCLLATDPDMDDYKCECHLGYSGRNCTTYVCSSNPCLNNGTCVPDSSSKGYKCTCQEGFSGEDCGTTPSPPPAPTTEFLECNNSQDCGENMVCNGEFHCVDVCSNNPCQNDGMCVPDSKGYKCTCQGGFSGEDCGTTPSPAPTTESGAKGVVPTPVYQQPAVWAIAIFIVVLVICVLAYIGYHNRNKILELFGGKKESVVEMAMRNRTKKKGYKKLPTSIHDTLTHED